VTDYVGKKVMKYKIKATDENLALLAYLKESDKQSVKNTFWLPLISNLVAGIVAAALVVSITWNVEKDLKKVELQNSKASVVWQARVEATKENMVALSNLHNFIKYDLKKSIYNELDDGRLLEGFAANSVTPLMFKDYMVKHQETMRVIKSNSALLSKDMAESTSDFLLAMERLININLVSNFQPEKLFPITITGSVKPEYPESAYKMLSEMVGFFELNFMPHYDKLESEYRNSLALEAD
ncbi:hypothetical protein ACS1UC_004738, partial [Vibrio parahaemolyticus]